MNNRLRCPEPSRRGRFGIDPWRDAVGMEGWLGRNVTIGRQCVEIAPRRRPVREIDSERPSRGQREITMGTPSAHTILVGSAAIAATPGCLCIRDIFSNGSHIIQAIPDSSATQAIEGR
ncbi:MAG: hypothetical protein KAJ19_12290 [Gammaproteobacteria bacterium]|nr:hypothetical protein [Gammaproteobacteria bacterium]